MKDVGKVMTLLHREDMHVNNRCVVTAAIESLPPRRRLLSLEERVRLEEPTELVNVDDYVNLEAIECAPKKVKRNKSPGIDGFTLENFISLTSGVTSQAQLKQELMRQYTKLLQKEVIGGLSSHQNSLFNALKLADIPKK